MKTSSTIVQRLWTCCNVLQNDRRLEAARAAEAGMISSLCLRRCCGRIVLQFMLDKEMQKWKP
jgi:hypothetical protein